MSNDSEKLEKALKILKKLEWSGIAHMQYFTVPRCPICDGLMSDTKINESQTEKGGHKPGCGLAELLA